LTGSEYFEPADVPFLGLLAPDVRRLVMATLRPTSFDFGSTVAADSETLTDVHIVVAGRIRRIVERDGREVTLDIFGPGSVVGAMELLGDEPFASVLRASSGVITQVLDGKLFRALEELTPTIRDHFAHDIERRTWRAFLRTTTPFASLPEPGLTAFLDSVSVVEIEAGAPLAGDAAHGALYVVETGRLRSYRGAHGGRQDLAYFRRGDIVAVPAPDNGTGPVSTEAVSAARLLVVRPDVLTPLLADPSVREHVARARARFDHPAELRIPLDFAADVPPPPATASRSELAEPAAVGRGSGASTTPESPIEPTLEPDSVTVTPAEGIDRTLTRSRGRRRRRVPLVLAVDEADCGVACLAMLCRHYGHAPSMAQVRRETSIGVDGTSLHGLTRGAEALGLTSRGIKVSRDNLDRLRLPVITHWDGNHWVVLDAVGARTVRVADPAVGFRRMSRADFDERWTGYTVLAHPDEAFGGSPRARPARTWLLPLFRPYLQTMLLATLLAVAVAAMQLAVPIFIQLVVDHVLPSEDVDLLRTLMLSLLAVAIAIAITSLVQRYLLSRAAVRLDGAALDVLTSKLLALPLRYFHTRRTGDIQRRLVGVRLVREFAVQQAVVALAAAAQVVVSTALMFIYSPTLAAVFLATAPVYVVLMRFAMRRLRPIFDGLEEALGRYSSRQVDAIKGIETVKSLGAESAIRQQLVDEFDGLARRQFRADFTSMAFEAAVQVVTFVSLALFLWIGSLEVLSGDLSVGRLVTFSALVVFANAAIVMLLLLWDQLQFNTVLVNRLDDIFDEQPEQGRDHSQLLAVNDLGGRVEVHGICFRYGDDESPPVLDDVTFEVAPGTTVAIVGRSGSGKTTLVKCLAGLVEPTAGRIRYDTVDLRTVEYRQLRLRIGVVLQENHLFSDTIAANIALGGELDIRQVEWAARVANADEFIERLPFGYQTKVGETGLLLSGGQRQRIAIARAIYRLPPILILDEATSSLDTESEKLVKDNLGRLSQGRTTFVIAHRLSTVRDADLILVLDRGRIVERGRHSDLMHRRGLYYHLTTQQLDL
jgi:ATP-binding cassette subfamily B protein